ncbi:hypothetical protein [Streptomyces sp. NPDC014623]
MARLIPIVLIALALWFWVRARRKTSAYMASYEHPAGEGGERRDPPAPAA